MALVLPKYVTLSNFKLSVLYYLLLLVFVVALASRFFNWEQNSTITAPRGYVNAWVEGHADSSALDAAVASLHASLCSKSSSYEFWRDTQGKQKHGPHTCIPLCNTTAASGEMCVRPAETYFREAADSVFFVTEFSERYLDNATADRSFFVPSTDALQLGLEYSFSISDRGPFDIGSSMRERSTHATSHDVLTVLVHTSSTGEHHIYDTFKPSEQVVLTVRQLLQLADTSLDDIRSSTGSNQRPGAEIVSGALTRLSGLEVSVELSCHESISNIPVEVDVEWDGPVCLAEVLPHSSPWVSTEKLYVVDAAGSLRHRIYHGVRVRFSVGGSYLFFDINKMLLNLACCLIFLAFPAYIIFFICIYCLGHLSTMYRQRLYDRCDWFEEGAGVAARLLSISSAYEQLEDVYDSDSHGISRHNLKSRLRSLVPYRDDDVLCDTEMEQLVNFCYRTLAKDEHELITAEDFTVAHSSIEPFSVGSFLKLINMDHKPAPLEKFFMPKELSAFRQELFDSLQDNWNVEDPEPENYETDDTLSASEDQKSKAKESHFRKQQVKDASSSQLFSRPLGSRLRGAEKADHLLKGGDPHLVEVVIGKSSPSLQEPNPEPFGQLYLQSQSIPQRLNSLETSLRECQDRIFCTLETMNARLDRLEGGLAACKHETSSTRKSVDMLEALTGHNTASASSTASSSIFHSISTSGRFDRYPGKSDAEKTIDLSSLTLDSQKLKSPASTYSKTILSPRNGTDQDSVLPPPTSHWLSDRSWSGGAIEADGGELPQSKRAGRVKRLDRKTRVGGHGSDKDAPHHSEGHHASSDAAACFAKILEDATFHSDSGLDSPQLTIEHAQKHPEKKHRVRHSLGAGYLGHRREGSPSLAENGTVEPEENEKQGKVSPELSQMHSNSRPKHHTKERYKADGQEHESNPMIARHKHGHRKVKRHHPSAHSEDSSQREGSNPEAGLKF